MKEAIAKVLMEFCQAFYVQVLDESGLHKGHREAIGDGNSHFRVTIVANDFDGKSRLQRHRFVYQCCDDFLNKGVHALAIQAFTQKEWREKNG